MPGCDILAVSGRRTGFAVGYDCAVTSLDWPALMPWDAESVPAAAPGAPREAMVVFRDGTWRLCRVTGWWQEPPPAGTGGTCSAGASRGSCTRAGSVMTPPW